VIEDARDFNLIDESWIRARAKTGELVELSIRDLFHQAKGLVSLSNDIPTQDFAILRMLLAILQRSVLFELDEDEDDPAEAWKTLWGADDLPTSAIDEYLNKWHDRFNLLDDQAPFMQVHDLEATNGVVGESRKIIADIPDGDSLFTLRSGESAEKLGYAEAARWLVHVHAFDTSGIKSGVIGDPSVKGGKSYPIGTGWAGRLGGVFLEGDDMRQTLLLNLVMTDDDYSDICLADDDMPVWEQNPKRPGDEERQPAGTADLYTWQSRRVRLFSEGGVVTGVTLSNGDKLEPYDMYNIEPMTAWRRSENLEKKLGRLPVYYPITHRSGRALWRGLTSVITEWPEDGAGGVATAFKAPLVVGWAGYLASENSGKCLSEDYSIRVHATGFEYGVQNSVVSEAIDDVAEMHTYLLSPQGKVAANLVKQCVKDTDEAVRALGYMAKQLSVIGGGDDTQSSGAYNEAIAEAFFEIDGVFRVWLSQLCAKSILRDERARWNKLASCILRAMAQRMVEESSSSLIVGRKVTEGKREHWVTAASIESRFYFKLRQVLPCEDLPLESEEQEGKNEASV